MTLTLLMLLLMGIQTSVNVHVFSANENWKIPKDALHRALKSGGASRVGTDPRQFNYRSGSNDSRLRGRIDTNLHIARLDF